jgi:hypothetical protein
MANLVTTALDLPPSDAIAFLRGKNLATSTHWTDVWKQAHARSFMVAGAATEALVGDFHEAVTRAIAEGRSLKDFRKDFDAIVEKHGWAHNGSAAWRSKIIYETNLSMAYAAGRYAQMIEPGTLAVFPFWEYLHTSCRHPRLQHLAWSGLVLRADDPWWDTHYPPNGWRCGCRVRPMMRRELARRGKSGPDTAPPIELRAWTNPKTGIVHQVPVGIDPGFDYNVGKAWKGTPPPLPANIHIPPDVPRMVPTPAPTLAPAPPPVAPAPDTGPVEVDTGAPEITHPIAPSPADFSDWAQRVIDTGRPGGTSWPVATIPEAVAREVLPDDAPRDVTLSGSALRHLLRDSKERAKRALSLIDALALPARLAQPLAILLDTADNKLLFVFAASNDADQRLAKVVVATDAEIADGRGKYRRSNVVVTAGLVQRNNLRLERYRLLSGTLE